MGVKDSKLSNYHYVEDIKYYDLEELGGFGDLAYGHYASILYEAGYDIVVSKSSLKSRIDSLKGTISNKNSEIEKLNNKNGEDNSTKEREIRNLKSEIRSKEIELKKKSDEIYRLKETIKNKELTF